MADVEIIHEVTENWQDEQLCFQWCKYNYGEGSNELGYRFIWRKPDGSLRPARGQAIIYNAAQMFRLVNKAIQEGWFISCENRS